MQTRPCPYCAEEIQADALKCRYCREWLIQKEEISEEVIEYSDNMSYISLDKDNIVFGYIISILLFFVNLMFIHPYFNTKEKYVPLIIVMVVLSSVLLYVLGRYLSEFELYNNIDKNAKQLSLSLAALATFLLFIFIMSSEFYVELLTNVIVQISFVIILTILIVSHALVSWRLARFENDYIGGLSSLGYAMCVSLVFPLALLALPVFTFNVFHKAKKYVNLHGK